jgi:hypothetical protein
MREDGERSQREKSARELSEGRQREKTARESGEPVSLDSLAGFCVWIHSLSLAGCARGFCSFLTILAGLVRLLSCFSRCVLSLAWYWWILLLDDVDETSTVYSTLALDSNTLQLSLR